VAGVEEYFSTKLNYDERVIAYAMINPGRYLFLSN